MITAWLQWPIRALSALNVALSRVALAIGAAAMALMVVAILIQVFFRYVLNNALPWPDEAARFCMLWMTGLMAPTALRRGGFVAIDMLPRLLPVRVSGLLTVLLHGVALLVLVMAVSIAWKEVTGFGGRFTSAALYVPTSWDFQSWLRVPRSWMMASLLVGFVLMCLSQIELLLRSLYLLVTGEKPMPVIETGEVASC